MFEVVELSCSIIFNGERVNARIVVDAAGYRDPDLAEYAHQQVREALVREILKKYPPEIVVRR